MCPAHLRNHAQGMAPRHDGGLVDGVRAGRVERHERVAALMIRCPPKGLCRSHHRPAQVSALKVMAQPLIEPTNPEADPKKQSRTIVRPTS
jgi:hypothetical protein